MGRLVMGTKRIRQMPRFLIALIAFLASATLYGQEAKKPSPQVKRILDKAVGEVKKNRQAFDKANERPLGDARVELQDLSTKLIREGKTVDASAVLKQIETLDVDVMRRANAPAPVSAPRPAPQKPLLERMAGKWVRINTPFFYRLHSNGVAECVDDKAKRVVSQGRINPTSVDIAEVRWSDGFRDIFYLAGDDVVAVRQWDPVGKRENFALERIE
jgi:hypothetical protein